MKLNKMKLLILFFFSINIYAGYMSKVKMLDCDSSGRTFYMRMTDCQKTHNDCTLVPKDFHCKTFSELDTNVDDTEKPTYSKSDIEACTDQANCEFINLSKTCIDATEIVYMSENYSEIYCSKVTGYQQKIVKMIREDAPKKTIYDDELDSKAAKKLILKNKRKDAKALISKLEGNSDLTSTELRQVLITILKELRD